MHAGLQSRSLDLYLQINYTSMRKVMNTKTKYSQKFAIELFFVTVTFIIYFAKINLILFVISRCS